MSKISFRQLLNSKTQFKVPIIQRDYAQGRNDGADKDLCEEVRSDIVDSLFNSLKNNSELVLDYVYGSDIDNIFYPIDGQQRLTTLFLLHWYIGKKENVSQKEMEFLKKFSYEIRDTSIEFCLSLVYIDLDLSINTAISDQIKNSSKYHKSYDYDPTICSMLVMLDKIDDVFRNEDTVLWTRLDNIKFWVLSLTQFGLTDDLFVKMNARGKRLSRFDTFKSDLESKLTKIGNSSIVDKWKKEIDNNFLDQYWLKFGVSKSELNIFRTILFYVKMYITGLSDANQYDESWEINTMNVKYNEVINYISSNISVLDGICEILSKFNIWYSKISNSNLFVNNIEEKNINYYEKAEDFGILYWFSKSSHSSIDSNFDDFHRILKNYIYSLRQADYKPRRRWSSSIDNKSIAKVIGFIKNQLIDAFDDSVSYYDYICSTTCPELSFERKKIIASRSGQVSLNDIIQLENIPWLKTNIHNIFYNGQIVLEASQIEEIFDYNDLLNKALRIIFSYANDEYGKFQKLLFDPIGMQSGKKSLYYNNQDDQATSYFHKYSFGAIDDDFGDRVLTSKGTNQYDEMSKSVKSFLSDIKMKLNEGLSISDSVNNLLAERIASEDYSQPNNIKWYIVKYKEFFYGNDNTTISSLRRKDYVSFHDVENVYDIQCISNDNDFEKMHYHPFYLAVCHLLNNENSNITLDENSLKYTGVHIEYAHPCVLSNGWIIRILDEGDWKIQFKNNRPSNNVLQQFNVQYDTTTNSGLIVHNSTDCIRRIVDFIKAC